MSATGLHDYAQLVELPLQKKIASLLAGQHHGIGAGLSHELLDMADYQVGNAISDIDWKVTARQSRPIVKRSESTAVLNIQMVVDLGASMAGLAGNGKDTKAQVAQEFVTATAAIAAKRGDMLGMVAGNSGEVRSYPSRSGFQHAQELVDASARVTSRSQGADLARLLRHLGTPGRPRSMVFLITDIHQFTPDLSAALHRLRFRHSLYALLITDLDPTQEHEGHLSDVNWGDLPDFLRDDPTLAYQWHIVNGRQRQLAEQVLTDQHIPFAYANGPEDVLGALIAVLGGGRRGPLTA